MGREIKTNRIEYIDLIRVVSIIAVIILHVSGETIRDTSITSNEWMIMNLYESVVRWGVPTFIMISGALFLSKDDIPLRVLYGKYIKKIVIAYLVWSAFYAICIPVAKYIILKDSFVSFGQIILNVIRHDGVEALWFLPMIIGIYMCIPIFKAIIKSSNIVYFLFLSFFFSILCFTLKNVLTDFGIDKGGGYTTIGQFIASILGWIDELQVYTVVGYPFYFLLGYYLAEVKLTKNLRVIIYFGGILGACSTVFLTQMASFRHGNMVENYYSNFSVNVMLMAVAAFVCLKELSYRHPFCKKIAVLGKYCFGVYLVHIFIRNALMMVGVDTMAFTPALSIIIISIIVTTVSFLISILLHKIPVINKWCV